MKKIILSINQDYLELVTEAKQSNKIKAIIFESVDVKEIENLAYITINERINKSSRTIKFNKTYVIEKNNKVFANLNDIFMSNDDYLYDVAKQICEVDDNLDYETVTNELFLSLGKRNINWTIVNGNLQIHVDPNVFEEGSNNINYEANIKLIDDLEQLSR